MSGSSSPGGCAAALPSGSSVGPSTPQFQLRLSSAPSRLSSPFASLCLVLYETRSLSVNPSWQVTKLMLCSGSRSSLLIDVRASASAETPAARTMPLSPLRKALTSSRNRPFHSFQLSPTKRPDLVEPGRVPGFRDQLDVGEHRVRLDVPKDRRRGHRTALLRRATGPRPRSKRKPSTCISLTQ